MIRFPIKATSVSYTHLRAHETDSYLVCRLLLEKNGDHRDLHYPLRRQRQMCIRDRKDGGAWTIGLKNDMCADDSISDQGDLCLLYTSPSPRDGLLSRMPSSA